MVRCRLFTAQRCDRQSHERGLDWIQGPACARRQRGHEQPLFCRLRVESYHNQPSHMGGRIIFMGSYPLYVTFVILHTEQTGVLVNE